MSTDWWTPTQSTTQHHPSFHTPSRPSHLHNSTRPRFAGDELDPEDAKMADGIKFLPSFASSPAGKLALGQSPSSGMGGGGGSPTAGMGTSVGGAGGGGGGGSRRSPTARFTPGAGESPRNSRRQGGSSQAFAMDEDLPPTTSLHDGETPTPSRTVSSPASLPTPPSLLPNADTTTLHIFGPPLDVLSGLEPYLNQMGPVTKYAPGPEGSNWWVVEYANPTAASYALRRHGEIVQGRWMLGFKVAGPGSLAGCTLVEGDAGPARGGGGGGAGTPIRIQNAQIIRQKQVVAKSKGEDYAWEDGEKPVGWGNWVAEKLFGS